MRFYLANVSRQDASFNYRLPEHSRPIAQPIRMGQQVQLRGDLNTPQVDSLIEQLHVLGARKAGDYSDVKGVVPFLYSVDAQIKPIDMRNIWGHNRGRMIEVGKEMRAQAAIATNNEIERLSRDEGLPGSLMELEMTVQQEEQTSSGDAQLSEGVIVDTGRKKEKDGGAKGKKRSRS